MSETGHILREEDVRELESYMDETSGNFYGMLECLGRIMHDGMSEGRFTEKEAQHDLDFALWVAYACNNISDYEHYCTSCDWLARVEDVASGVGEWYYRYGVALMYTGKTRIALEYLSRGSEEDPSYPWVWLTLGKLRAHFGDRDGALMAARTGLALVPGDYEFETLLTDIEEGRTLEEMEFHFIREIDDEGLPDLESAMDSDDPEVVSLTESVMGMVCDKRRLFEIREALDAKGWIPDHPYCTYMMDNGGSVVLVTFEMNEAYLSKLDVADLKRIVDALPEMERKARESMEILTNGDTPLFGLTIDRRLFPMLSFGDSAYQGQPPMTVRFTPDLEILREDPRGGPFAAFVLLSSDSWDPDLIKQSLRSDWGIVCKDEVEDDNLVFELDGDLVAISMVHGPVPGGECEENAANNYMWPGAEEIVSTHVAHLIVALVNHGGSSPVDAGCLWTRIVASCGRMSNVVGIYTSGTVHQPAMYLMTADLMKSGELPVCDMVWLGLYRSEGRINAYTCGMTMFGKDEMEILGSEEDPDSVRELLFRIVHYVLSNDITLNDGDSIGVRSEDEILGISRSPGISVDDVTLKIECPPKR